MFSTVATAYMYVFHLYFLSDIIGSMFITSDIIFVRVYFPFDIMSHSALGVYYFRPKVLSFIFPVDDMSFRYCLFPLDVFSVDLRPFDVLSPVDVLSCRRFSLRRFVGETSYLISRDGPTLASFWYRCSTFVFVFKSTTSSAFNFVFERYVITEI